MEVLKAFFNNYFMDCLSDSGEIYTLYDLTDNFDDEYIFFQVPVLKFDLRNHAFELLFLKGFATFLHSEFEDF